MKIQIISDLHQEFGSSDLSFDNADVVVLAGDVNLGTKGIEWIKTLNKIQNAAKNSNVLLLENSFVDIEDVRFHGATLWTDFSLFGSAMVYGSLCQTQMNDYKLIRRDPSYSKMRSIDTFKIHQFSRQWLKDSLENSKGMRNIVVTHHAPSIKSVSEHFKKDPVTSAYASNLESFIEEYQPLYWIHGHIHTPSRYKIGETEIICNPHGYVVEKYNGYEKELIIEL